MRFAVLAAAFLDARTYRLQPNTLRGYRCDLGMFARAFPNLDVRDMDVTHLRTFMNTDAGRTPGTAARRRAALGSCFRWALRHGHVDADPTTLLDPVRVPARESRPLSESQAEALLVAVPARPQRNRLLFTMLYETGMRVGEALALRTEQVTLNSTDGGSLRLVGSGRRLRVVPLIEAPRTVRLLTAELKSSPRAGPLFTGDPNKGGKWGSPLDYSTVYHHFERALETARRCDPALFNDIEVVTIERLRHTWAALKLQDGVPVATLSKMMGHSHLHTTLRYAEPALSIRSGNQTKTMEAGPDSERGRSAR